MPKRTILAILPMSFMPLAAANAQAPASGSLVAVFGKRLEPGDRPTRRHLLSLR